MTDNSSTSVRLPDALGSEVKQLIQYGVRYPNGSVIWEEVPTFAGRKASAEKLALSNGSHERYTALADWQRHLKDVARQALVDEDEYVASHSFVTRTVVVAVTQTVHLDGGHAVAVPEGPKAVPAPPWS